MWTMNFQMFKLDLEKAEEPEIKLPTSSVSWKKNKKIPEKHLLQGFPCGSARKKKSTSASLTTLKPLTVWIMMNCGKFFKRMEYQTTLPTSWENCMSQRLGDLLSNTGWLHKLGGTRCWCSWLAEQCSFSSSHPCLFLEPFLLQRQTLIKHTLC